jgi:L-ascorbate metabolism protein UlaG (beta-lactamase superfamily)
MPLPAPTPVPLPSVGAGDAPFLSSPVVAPGRYANPWGARNEKSFADVFRWKVTSDNPFAADKRSRPPTLPVAADPAGRWDALEPGARVQWLGHASVLVELDGVTALIDPVFGAAGPGVRRFVPPPRLPDTLPRIDVVLLSHGHYDHLDRRSLDAVARAWPEALFVVPEGQAGSLPRSCRRVVSLLWWEQVDVRGVRCTLVPAQHWHRRGPFDQDRALWGGWHLRGSRSLYHSGDTGYFGGFGMISRVLGAPDVAVLPLGAYEPRWFMAMQHMSPEDSLQAWADLDAGHLLAMHWGTFDLTDEPLDHGAFTLLPRIAEERGLDTGRLHVLAHGGALGFEDPEDVVPTGRAVRP